MELSNDGSNVSGLDWLAAPSGTAADFEFRVSRAAQYDSDGTPVFAGDTIAFLLEAENAQFTTVEVAPDAEGLAYIFTPAPAAATDNSALITLTNTSWRESMLPEVTWERHGGKWVTMMRQ